MQLRNQLSMKSNSHCVTVNLLSKCLNSPGTTSQILQLAVLKNNVHMTATHFSQQRASQSQEKIIAGSKTLDIDGVSFFKKQSTSPCSFHWHSKIFLRHNGLCDSNRLKTFNMLSIKVGISRIVIQRTNRQNRHNL